MIIGRIGSSARDIIDASGIKIVTGASSTVRETLKLYLKGQLQPSPAETVHDRSFRTGRGRKIGQGSDMGWRRGRRSQRRQLMNQTASMTQASTLSRRQTTGLSKKEETQNLKAQAHQIQQQLLHLRKRLDK